MKIEVKTADVDGKTVEIAEIFFSGADSSGLPLTYAQGSTAYCFKGSAKGKLYVYDGDAWEEQ